MKHSHILNLPGIKAVNLEHWPLLCKSDLATFPAHFRNYLLSGKSLPLYEYHKGTESQPKLISREENEGAWQWVLDTIRAKYDPNYCLDKYEDAEPCCYFIDVKDIADFCEASSFSNPYGAIKGAPSHGKIIGALCHLYWDTKYSNSDKKPPLNQSSIISSLLDFRIYGMGERTLKEVLPSALKEFESKRKSNAK